MFGLEASDYVSLVVGLLAGVVGAAFSEVAREVVKSLRHPTRTSRVIVRGPLVTLSIDLGRDDLPPPEVGTEPSIPSSVKPPGNDEGKSQAEVTNGNNGTKDEPR